MTDRLTLAHAIEDAGIERIKAEALAGAIFEAIHDNVATKVDIHDLRSEIAELRSEMKAEIQELRSDTKAEIQELRSEVKAEIQELRSEMRGEIAQVRSEIAQVRSEIAQLGTSLRAEMAQLEHRVLIRLGGLIVVLLGLLFAALHAWPPGQG
jgi:ribosomal protein L29